MLVGGGSGGFEIVIQAPVNIALIKYWGKRNEELVLPLNDSISLAINELIATTNITIGPRVSEDAVKLNGKSIDIDKSHRFRKVFESIRRYGRKRSLKGELISPTWHINIESITNFPTAAGLASSAAGFAAIAYGLGQIFRLPERDIIRLARIGSGSACRSIQNGFVHWRAGSREQDDADCFCESFAPTSHWAQLRALVVVVSEASKKVGSSCGMQNTVRTSALLQSRVREVVPKRVEQLKKAIRERDFVTLAQITMAESNQLHAVCLDTNPPLSYLNDTSHALMDFVHDFNAHFGCVRLAYTFDAGPNCCMLFERRTHAVLKRAFVHCFSPACEFPDEERPKENQSDELDSLPLPQKEDAEAEGADNNNFSWLTPKKNAQIERLILSELGVGPRVLKFGSLEMEKPKPAGDEAPIKVDCKML